MKEKEFWFRRKRYGWGWYPTSWKGWSVLLVYLVFVIGGPRLFYFFSNEHAPYWSAICLFAATIVLAAIVWKKGESPHWQWGEKEKDRM